ncbi:MAG: prepilin peptidase, partial [Actinomycetes bacterium]|nr:prepilin peptidase [Actinomycetes bacterium]MDX5380569.1 prepilin peptidase [Actinomycetes bacterium]MDX5399464.1 prepilin peptidase [Actinomycetes bacterium]MDX5450309.1 prepilin peptidase [Actinomycetes bacterium]
MPPLVIVLTAAALGIAAMALTGWMQRVAGEDSMWLEIGLHVFLATFLGAGAAALAQDELEVV